jgi:hypothetical protein
MAACQTPRLMSSRFDNDPPRVTTSHERGTTEMRRSSASPVTQPSLPRGCSQNGRAISREARNQAVQPTHVRGIRVNQAILSGVRSSSAACDTPSSLSMPHGCPTVTIRARAQEGRLKAAIVRTPVHRPGRHTDPHPPGTHSRRGSSATVTSPRIYRSAATGASLTVRDLQILIRRRPVRQRGLYGLSAEGAAA